MQYRTDKRAKREISALGLGCMRFPKKGGGFDYDATRTLVRAAIDKGINYLDTAYIYGNSEELLGRILSEDGLRDKVCIATKLPLIMVRSGADFDKYFSRQLERLKTDRIEYYLMHMITDFKMWENLKRWGIEDWVARKKAEGKIERIGFSYHGGREDFPRVLNDYDWDFTQIQYNYLDENNQAGKSGLELAASKNIPVIVMEPLRGGKLAGEIAAPARDALSAANPGVSPAEYGLRWVWNHPEVTCVLSGMSDMGQLEENVRVCETAAPNSMSPELLAGIAGAKAALDKLIKVPCTACGYCMPCPFGVDIPTSFAHLNQTATDARFFVITKYMQNINALGHEPRFAGKCRDCGKCESHCPQSIPIRAKLKETAAALEPAWFKAGMWLYRKLARSGSK